MKVNDGEAFLSVFRNVWFFKVIRWRVAYFVVDAVNVRIYGAVLG